MYFFSCQFDAAQRFKTADGKRVKQRVQKVVKSVSRIYLECSSPWLKMSAWIHNLISLEYLVKMHNFSEMFKKFDVIRNYWKMPSLFVVVPPFNFNITQTMDAVLVWCHHSTFLLVNNHLPCSSLKTLMSYLFVFFTGWNGVKMWILLVWLVSCAHCVPC